MAKHRKYTPSRHITGWAYPPRKCGPAASLKDPNTIGGPPPAGTTFAPGPAQKLNNIHVQLIFWGGWWNNNPLATQVKDAVTNLLAGPYMSYLAQYGVHRGNVRGTTFATDSEPGTFSYDDVGNFIVNTLDNEGLPEPDEDWPLVYAVIMPINSAFQGDPQTEHVPLPPGTLSGVSGANSSLTWRDFTLGDVDNDPAYYCWVGNDGTLNFITTVLSHELVELATDPNGGDGVRKVGCTGPECQIGDVCGDWCDSVRGVRAQAYWSQLDGNCVLPVMYSVRRTLAGKSIGGKIPGPIASLNAWITAQF